MNPTSSPQSVGGYVVKRYGATNDEYVIPANTTIPAGGFYSISAGTLGYTEEQIGKMWSGNLVRVMRETEKVAAAQQKKAG